MRWSGDKGTEIDGAGELDALWLAGVQLGVVSAVEPVVQASSSLDELPSLLEALLRERERASADPKRLKEPAMVMYGSKSGRVSAK